MHTFIFKLNRYQITAIVLCLVYSFLWIGNPSNKIILGLFFLVGIILSVLFRNISTGFFITYLSTIIIHTGKSYQIQLIPPGLYSFSPDRWPNGYEIKLIITPAIVFASILAFILLYNFTRQKEKLHQKISVFDVLILFYPLIGIIANLFASQEPLLSTVGFILGLHWLIGYVYIRFLKHTINLRYLFILILTVFTVVQSITSVHQYVNKSPLGKTIESQILIETFGDAVDELAHKFRPVGTFTHANDLGAFLALSLSILTVYAISYRSKWLLFSTFIGFCALILTMSRSAWIAFALSISIICLSLRKKILLYIRNLQIHYAFIIIGFLITLLLVITIIMPRIQKSMYTFSETGGGGYIRSQQIRTTIELIALYPFTGVGWGMSVPQSLQREPDGVFLDFPAVVHNSYLLNTVELGLPYICIFFLLMWYILNKVYNKPDRLAIGIFSAMIGALFIGYFQPIFMQSFIFLLFSAYVFQQKNSEFS